jgi:thioredoxin reductase (NADPH)
VPDFNAIIIGGGPAGLTAGLYLCRGGWRTLLIEKETVGGYIMNIDLIENYPGFPGGVVGSQLGMEMKQQAVKYGLKTERNEVVMLDSSTENITVSCADGTVYTASVVIISGGSVPKKLEVPGEAKLSGNGVISCAFCDGARFKDQVVAVIGGGDSGLSGALYLAKIASKVTVIEALPELTATAILRDRVKENRKIDVRTGVKVSSILGESTVEGIEVEEKGKKITLKTDGVLVQVGLDPNTDYLEGVVPLDRQHQVVVNTFMETEVPGIFAAGDIRSQSPGQVSTAVGDGAVAAVSAQQYLQKLM